MKVNHEIFAPGSMWLTQAEESYRKQMCLNGSWQFQPVPVPPDYVRDTGQPPQLPLPEEDKWSQTPIRIPSPWNGNNWGNGRVEKLRSNPETMYRPDSVYYPSYPEEWDHAEMGWLRRTVVMPQDWIRDDMRIVVHFEAVMGHAQVYWNGQKAGEHFDGYLPFDIDVTDLVVPGENTLLVGVRRLHLYNKQSKKYKRMKTPYPHGSNTQGLGGIWQDVFLVAMPRLRIEDVFIKPLVDADCLEVDLTIRNDTDRHQTAVLSGKVVPWGDEGQIAMPLTQQKIMISPHNTVTITVRDKVKGRLKLWSPDTPHLYSMEWTMTPEDAIPDHKSTRFGWRQFHLEGQNILLNGQEIHLVGDICHPFGPYMFSRRFVESWYRLIKSVGGNAVRLHAQIHPRVFLDVADEMGILVLDETAIFGSCITLNFEEEVAWQRYAEHFDGLILRDRNRPSVFGWSFGNELFAIFLYDEVAKRDEDPYYAKLFELGNRARALDPTREFVTCDGDEDLRGTLPVWSKHYAHGLRNLPAHVTKPIVIGEHGGTYYARPEQMAEFNGEEAYLSYSGRNRALGIDLYQNLRLFNNRLAYFSPSELVWFGLEHLPYGYDDFSRLPNGQDGIWFTNFEEGRPGMYIERIPPYVGTLNPGFDPDLPEYRPLAMYQAMKEALTFDPQYDDKWKITKTELPSPPVYARREGVRLIGDPNGQVGRVLRIAGVDFAEDGNFVVVDAATCGNSHLSEVEKQIEAVTENGGTVLLMIGETLEPAGQWLPYAVRLTQRPATMLKRVEAHPYIDSISVSDMYFAELPNTEERYILRHGMDGELVDKGKVLLAAGDTDWSLFNNIPEQAKCASVVLYEHLQKENGAALVLLPCRKGTLLVSTITAHPNAQTAAFYHKLLLNMGCAVGDIRDVREVCQDMEHDLLLNGPVEFEGDSK